MCEGIPGTPPAERSCTNHFSDSPVDHETAQRMATRGHFARPSRNPTPYHSEAEHEHGQIKWRTETFVFFQRKACYRNGFRCGR